MSFETQAAADIAAIQKIIADTPQATLAERMQQYYNINTIRLASEALNGGGSSSGGGATAAEVQSAVTSAINATVNFDSDLISYYGGVPREHQEVTIDISAANTNLDTQISLLGLINPTDWADVRRIFIYNDNGGGEIRWSYTAGIVAASAGTGSRKLGAGESLTINRLMPPDVYFAASQDTLFHVLLEVVEIPQVVN